LIFWTNEEDALKDGFSGAKLEAIFSLEECFVIDSDPEIDTVSILENRLESAIQNEKYEEAAILRDAIKEKRKKK
jgi:excinuclease UvrABC helicase subunit UvrB